MYVRLSVCVCVCLCMYAATPSGCLSAYNQDSYCDDENNKARCGWDGGACCAQTNYGYVRKSYCKKVWYSSNSFRFPT